VADRQRETKPDLPKLFFQDARRVLLKETDALAFDPSDILRIAMNSALQAEFREMFRTEVNNPQLADLTIHHLEHCATDLESSSRVSDIKVDLIDRAGMAVAASVTVAAIGMAVVSGGSLGAILLLTGGLVGMAASGTSRTIIKLSGHRSSVAAEGASSCQGFGGRKMTGFDIHAMVYGAMGFAVALWCAGLGAYAVLSDLSQKTALLKTLTEELGIRLRTLGEEMRKANVSL
jgi:hypothetical protein